MRQIQSLWNLSRIQAEMLEELQALYAFGQIIWIVLVYLADAENCTSYTVGFGHRKD